VVKKDVATEDEHFFLFLKKIGEHMVNTKDCSFFYGPGPAL